MRTRMACAAVAATLTLATVAPAQAAEYQPTSVLPGFTGTLDAPLPRGEAWFEATSNPDWAMVGPDGTIRLAPGEDVTPGTYEWPVQATFQDNHTETYPVRVTVGQEQTADASQEGAVIDAFVQYAPEVTKQCSATALGVGLGAVLGMVAAMRGGWLDALIMRIGDIGLALPQLVFAMLAVTVLGPKGWVLILVVGLTHAPRTARVMRSAAVGVVGEDYVLASHMYAVPQWRILAQDILPNVTGPLMVELGLRMTYSIGALASLSFLGLGQQPPAPSWGSMLNTAKNFMAQAPWLALWPGLAIFLVVLGFNLLGDGLRDALDPRED